MTKEFDVTQFEKYRKLEGRILDLQAKNKRLSDWINWLQDEAVVNFEDNRVGMFRKIKEGLTVEDALKGE